MFNVITNPKFSRTITFNVPDGDGYVEQSFKALFKVLPSDQIEGLSWSDVEDIKVFLRKALISADDLVDADEKPVPFSEDIREWMLNLPYVRIALMKTYTLAQVQETAGN